MLKNIDLAKPAGLAPVTSDFSNLPTDGIRIFYNEYDSVKTGETVAVIFDGEQRHIGIARRNPTDPVEFNEAFGARIALGRAYYQMALSYGLAKKRKGQNRGWPKSLTIGFVEALSRSELLNLSTHLSGMLAATVPAEVLKKDPTDMVETDARSEQSVG